MTLLVAFFGMFAGMFALRRREDAYFSPVLV